MMSRMILTIRVLCLKFCERQSLSYRLVLTCLHNGLNPRTKLLLPSFSLPLSHDEG